MTIKSPAKAAGSQFTSEFTGALKRHAVTISMDGKGRCVKRILSSDCGEAA